MHHARLPEALLAAILLGWSAVPAAAGEIAIGSATGYPGQVVSFETTLSLSGLCMVSLEQTIRFAQMTPVLVSAMRPACRPPGTLVFYEFGFGFVPFGCRSGAGCTEFSFLGDAIDSQPPDGSLMYSCRVVIPADTPPGDYPLACVEQSIASCDYGRIDLDCTPGTIHVLATCAGDCGLDGAVTIDELIMGIDIFLGRIPPTACASFDRDGSGGVTVAELVRSLRNARRGCEN